MPCPCQAMSCRSQPCRSAIASPTFLPMVARTLLLGLFDRPQSGPAVSPALFDDMHAPHLVEVVVEDRKQPIQDPVGRAEHHCVGAPQTVHRIRDNSGAVVLLGLFLIDSLRRQHADLAHLAADWIPGFGLQVLARALGMYPALFAELVQRQVGFATHALHLLAPQQTRHPGFIVRAGHSFPGHRVSPLDCSVSSLYRLLRCVQGDSGCISFT